MSTRPRRAAAQKPVEQEAQIDSTTETNGKGKGGATKRKPVKAVKEIDPLAGGDDEPQKQTKTKGAKKEITNGEEEKPVPAKKGRGKKDASVEAENGGDEPKINKKGKKKEEVIESAEEEPEIEPEVLPAKKGKKNAKSVVESAEEEEEIEPEVLPAKKGKKNAKSVEEKEDKESSPTKKKKVEEVVEKPKRGRGVPVKVYTETVEEKQPAPSKGAKGKKKVAEPVADDEDKIEIAEPEKAPAKSKGRPKKAVSEEKEVIEAPKAKGGRSRKAASVEPDSKFLFFIFIFFKFLFTKI